MISWNNCRDKRIYLIPRHYVFPSSTIPNLLTMWYCGDISKNIPSYWILRCSDMRETKGGIQKLSMMKKLAENVEKGVRIVNLPYLLVKNRDMSLIFIILVNICLHFIILTKGSASRKLLGRLITIFCVLRRVI